MVLQPVHEDIYKSHLSRYLGWRPGATQDTRDEPIQLSDASPCLPRPGCTGTCGFRPPPG